MDEPVEQEQDLEGLFTKLKGWFQDDFEKSAQWREDAVEDFRFVAGDQWSQEDKEKLRDQLRPVITMNRIDPIIDSVSGSEVANRQEVRYIPREPGDVKVNEVLTSAAQWFRDQCDAEDEESDAFRDTIVCGMGWTETRLDYETDPDGEPRVERTDPLEMVWDSTARKRNLSDMRRVFHIRKNVPLEEAKALIQGEFDDAEYNASWVDSTESSDSHKDDTSYDKESEGRADQGVTLVRAQWWEREKVYRVMLGQEIKVLREKEFQDYQQKAQLAGVPMGKVVPGMQRIYKQAYLGARVLDHGDAPCKEHFSFNCITGKRDRNNGSWYGLVRGMKDPQRWANKWLSQALHILNSSAKGGIMAERGAFENDAEAEKSWAKQDAITWARPGAMDKIEPKPQSPIPAGFYQLMEFAVSSIRDTSGVNLEILGMRETGQAASLDRQRKQSSMTILQPLFDSLRRYRKMQGRQMLYIIREYLSDGRLVRIVGKEQEQYVPLVKQPGSDKFDIIVDDAPTSPNQKEQTWTMLQQILPAVGKMLPPQTWMALLEYSPLPSSAQQKIRDSIKPPTGPDGKPIEKPDPDVVKAQTEMKIAQEKAQAEQALKQQQAQFDIEVEMFKAQNEAQVAQTKLNNEMALANQRAALERELAYKKADDEAGLAAFKANKMMEIELTRAAQPQNQD